MPEVAKDVLVNNFFTTLEQVFYHSMIFPCKNLSIDEFKISSLFSNTITDVGLGDKNYEEVQKFNHDNWGIYQFCSHS